MIGYCAQQVQRYDHDRFIMSLFYKGDVRDALFALFAFNYEIAKTREVVTETTTGLIRLQWWRDAIQKIYDGEILEHEVVKPLAVAIDKFDLPQNVFNELIYAREFDVEDRQPSTMDGFMTYAELTTRPLNMLVLKVVGEEEGGDMLRHSAIRYGCIGCVRALPYHLQYRRCLLPEDVLQKYDLSVSKLYDWKRFSELKPVCEDVLNVLPNIGRAQSKFIRMNNVLSTMYQKKIKRLSYDVFDKKMGVDLNFKALRLWFGSL